MGGEVEFCHVCGREKKPYVVLLDNNILSYMLYEQAREDGPICQRCDQYYAMTGEFKDPSEEEFRVARDSVMFARLMHEWWTKNSPLDPDGPSLRDWDGTRNIARWYRERTLEPKTKPEGGENVKALKNMTDEEYEQYTEFEDRKKESL